MDMAPAERSASTSVGRRDWSTWPRYEAAVMGFREYWYPAMPSKQLGRKAVTRVLLGDHIVFLRDGGKHGRPYALHDRCLHRGVPLSLTANQFGGKGPAKQVFPGTLSCGYHGWTYDLKSGVMVAALTDGPDSPICGKVRIRTYPLEERLGWIWIYMGDQQPPPLENDIPKELFAGQPRFWAQRVTFREANWRYPLENAIDEAHPRYLHREALWRYLKQPPPAWNRSRVEYIEDGTYVTYVPYEQHFEDEYPGLGKWPHKRWYHRGRNAVQRVAVRMPCTVRVNQPGFVIVSWYVPIDANHHMAMQTVVKTGSAWEVLKFRAYYWLFYRWVNQVMFGNQDYQMLRVTDAPPERLFRPDVSIIAWRKMCEQARGAAAAAELPKEVQEDELRNLTREYTATI